MPLDGPGAWCQPAHGLRREHRDGPYAICDRSPGFDWRSYGDSTLTSRSSPSGRWKTLMTSRASMARARPEIPGCCTSTRSHRQDGSNEERKLTSSPGWKERPGTTGVSSPVSREIWLALSQLARRRCRPGRNDAPARASSWPGRSKRQGSRSGCPLRMQLPHPGIDVRDDAGLE